MTELTAEKSGKMTLDVLPYEVTVENHPDSGIEKGTIWYKREFVIHFGVGVNNAAIVCPNSIGKKCPIHEERARLERKWGKKLDEEQKETLRTLNGKKQIAMNIKDPENPKKVRVFVIASGKFWSFKGGGLQKELDEGGDENLSFFDVKDGKTLTVRFSDESFGGHDFLQASRIDFEDRPDMDEDKILAKTVDLDKMLNVMPYDKIKEMFLMVDEEDEDKPSKKSKSKKSDDDEDDEDVEEDEDEDEDDDSDSDDDKKPSKKKSNKASDDDDDDSDDEEEDEEPKGKKSSKKNPVKDEDEEEDDDDDDDPKPKKKGKNKKGDEDE